MTPLVSSAVVAKAFSTTPQTINAWTHEGRITPATWEGRIIRYDLEKVQAELAERAKRIAEESKRKAAASLA